MSSPQPTAAPVFIIDGQVFTASVLDGVTSFVLGPGQTLTAEGSLVVSGTTFSLPKTGSGIIVVNGKSSTVG